MTEPEQLLTIARLELKRPFNGFRAAIIGGGDISAPLASLLQNEGASARECESADQLRNLNEKFDLAFLFCRAEDDALSELMMQNSLVIDAAPDDSQGWSFYDGASTFSRVRVVSLLKNSI